MPPVGFQLLTIPKAAALIGVEERIIRFALRDGTGPAVTQIRKRKMIRTDLLRQWVDLRTTTGVASAAIIAAPVHAGLTLADALKGAGAQQQQAA